MPPRVNPTFFRKHKIFLLFAFKLGHFITNQIFFHMLQTLKLHSKNRETRKTNFGRIASWFTSCVFLVWILTRIRTNFKSVLRLHVRKLQIFVDKCVKKERGQLDRPEDMFIKVQGNSHLRHLLRKTTIFWGKKQDFFQKLPCHAQLSTNQEKVMRRNKVTFFIKRKC